MGPKLGNCCKPEQVGTKEYGKILKRIQVLQDGRVPAKDAKNEKLKDKKEEDYEKRVSEAFDKFEMEGFMAQKGLWNLAGGSVLQDREALLKEDGDMHEENFFSSWLREDGKNKKERMMEVDKENKRRDRQKEDERTGGRKERDGDC